MKCANCGKPIENTYFTVGDNFLQAKFFESEECNIFCSKDCLCEALSVIELYKEDKEKEEIIS